VTAWKVKETSTTNAKGKSLNYQRQFLMVILKAHTSKQSPTKRGAGRAGQVETLQVSSQDRAFESVKMEEASSVSL